MKASVSLLCLLLCPVVARASVELKDGDRVVLLGNTFIERELRDGWIETMLTATQAHKDITFRNLGWSGDSVFGDARSYFGPPQEGLDRLRKHLQEIKPTVVVACYGAVAAFEGDAGLQSFVDGYGRLIDLIRDASGGARVVLMSPPPCETLGAPLPDMTAQNERLATYSQAIGKLAAEKDAGFVDLFTRMRSRPGGATLTDNGVHYTDGGYQVIAGEICALFGTNPKAVDPAATENLRALIKEKNRLYFHRWRPQNETYLLGFRKHEQGNNAKEIAMFDPLVEEKEKAIAEARKAFIGI